jgi:hypothetical protein
MKNVNRWMVSALSLAVVAAPLANAQFPAGRRGRGQFPAFDSASVRTMHGEITRIDTVAAGQGAAARGGGRRGAAPYGAAGGVTMVRLELKADSTITMVQLGPSSYLDAQSVKLAVGDKVDVTGSQLTGPRGRSALIATKVTKGSAVLVLRDSTGMPRWGGRRGGRPPAG